MKPIREVIEKEVPCVLMQVALHLKGRSVLHKEVVEEGSVKFHFWAIPGGITLRLKEEGKRFTEWEELQFPLGVAVAQHLLQRHQVAA